MNATYGIRDVSSLRLRAAEGTTLHVLTSGEPGRPLIVLLHGFPEFAYAWRRFMAPLAAAGFHVAAPDQRGYGGSDKPLERAAYTVDRLAADVLALAERWSSPRFAVVGHDWGGVVAWHLAMHHPQRIAGAVILNAPCLGTFWQHLRRHPRQALKSAYVGLFQVPAVSEWALSHNDFAPLRRALVRTARPGTFASAEVERYREAWRMPGALTGMLNWYRALPLYATRLRARRIGVPVRVIWGDADPFLDRGLAEAGRAFCDQGSVVHVPAATHWVHHEEPRLVREEIVSFLAPRVA